MRAEHWIYTIPLRLRSLFRRQLVEQELDEELQYHLERKIEENIARGMPLEEARYAALRAMEGLDQQKEKCRDARRVNFIETLLQDLRYAFRGIARNLGFSTVAVLTLALGIGTSTTIFTVVHGVLLKPLPYPEPNQLLMLWERQLSSGTLGTVSPANFFDWREQSPSFSHMAAIDPYPDFILNGSGEPGCLVGGAVSSGFLSLFGVQMALGRDFTEEEDHPGNNNVVILSYPAWIRYFGARLDIIGKPVKLNNSSYTVIGVLPSNFSLVSKASDLQARNRFDLFTPLALHSPPEPWQRGTHPLCVFARLKPGVTLARAQTDLNRIAGILQRLYPEDDKNRSIAAIPLGQHVVANVRTALFTLLAAVGMLFLIACADIANLLLARAAKRQKEMSLRVALGASRRRLALQLLTESMVLAMSGGVLGAAIAFLSVPAVVRHVPANLPRASEIAVDGRVLAFTSLVAFITGIAFGLVPLFQTWQANPNDALKQSDRAVTAGHSWLRSVLIVGQVAIALVLLTGAGLMTKSFWTLLQVSPGFETEHILTARLSIPPQYANDYKFGTGQHREISRFQRELLDRVRNIPGVQSAAFTAYLPLSGTNNSWAFNIEGRPPKPAGVYDVTNYRPVSAGYFETIGIPIKRGRGFNAGDTEDSPLVAVINESMRRTYWGAQNPVGQRVRFGNAEWRTIVGVAGDVHHEALGIAPEPEMYVPYSQVPNVEARPTIVLRTSIEPTSVVSALRRSVAETGPSVPLDQVETMKQLVFGSVAESRFRTGLVLTFSLLALLVASIGLYGVMSYIVTQRIREFGIRMAVGATRGAVLRLVLQKATKLVCIGIAIGFAATAMLSHLIRSLLYGVKPLDPLTFIVVSSVLASVVLLASYIPARRATKVDPLAALRYE